MAMNTLTVAVVSSRSRFCDTDANLRHFASITKRASARGARLVCFPELALASYTTRREVLSVAEKVPGPSTGALSEIAGKHDVYMSVGMAEKAGARHYITQVLVGPKGYLGKYRKHHPTESEQECGFSAGKAFPTFSVDGFKLGINICADGRHDDSIAALQKARVDVIHHPHGNWLGLGRNAEEWTRGKTVYFVPRAVRARAYVLVNNSAGDTVSPEGTAQFGSGALIIDPLGQVMKRTTQKTRSEKMIVATLRGPLSVLIPEFEMRRLPGMPGR